MDRRAPARPQLPRREATRTGSLNDTQRTGILGAQIQGLRRRSSGDSSRRSALRYCTIEPTASGQYERILSRRAARQAARAPRPRTARVGQCAASKTWPGHSTAGHAGTASRVRFVGAGPLDAAELFESPVGHPAKHGRRDRADIRPTPLRRSACPSRAQAAWRSAAMIHNSSRASPGGSSAFRTRCTRRSLFVTVPSASHQLEAAAEHDIGQLRRRRQEDLLHDEMSNPSSSAIE